MGFFIVDYNGSTINVPSETEEMTVRRLKNNILRYFKKINYNHLFMYLVEDDETFKLDDNEIVDCDQTFILEIEETHFPPEMVVK
jgi:hypothetical protein